MLVSGLGVAEEFVAEAIDVVPLFGSGEGFLQCADLFDVLISGLFCFLQPLAEVLNLIDGAGVAFLDVFEFVFEECSGDRVHSALS